MFIGKPLIWFWMVLLMPQNRNKLIETFIGNLANSVLHSILEKAIMQEEIARKYHKELLTSLALAKKYREKINPGNPLPAKDVEYIRLKIIRRVKSELNQRTAKGYTGIDMKMVEPLVDKNLREMKIME